MARKNKLGTSFLNLDLPPKLEVKLKKYLKEKELSGKKFMRYLIKKEFNGKES